MKLRIYSTYIVSVLTWGLPAWRIGDKEERKLRHWNARMLTRMMQTKQEDFADELRKQYRDPEFDLVRKLRARRMRWLGHTLRLPETSLLRRVLTRGEAPPPGTILADRAVPAHSTMQELAEKAGNHETEEGKKLCAEWGKMCAAVEADSKESLPVNRTGAETEAALSDIGGSQLRVYTDGGADGNGARGIWGAAGWGVHVLEVPVEEDVERTVRADLWGPVVTEEADVFFCGADRGTNNTGELVGIGQGLMWLRDLAGDTPGEAVMLYDSGYAANVTSGRWKANANHALVAWTRRLLAEVEAVRTVHWVHVKGHSADGGNDRADALVQWGKGDGPFARLRENGGEGESRYGAATNWVALQTNETAVEEKAAEARGAASSVALGTNVIVGRRGL